MSIKPIDHNVMLPRTQELSSNKHIENMKNRNIVESGFIQQEKNIKKNQKKIIDTNKSSNTRITDEKRDKNQETPHNKKNRSQSMSESTEEEKEQIKYKNIGSNIDIRI
ncbi:hypothetical protein KQI41_09100 [Tissierella pigra]|uniref:Uncharacterized protein n=1 Tax=Tissierella pigra TaxID=2607614 RepID=A0A6N7XE16_9FIRM|nr:hypothetical protein [Tissierella pigra]MBU5426559.1 hypothetical protein [Tissierella pigra]MST99995.1 hypothetical protein [Tissierella pigra]